MRPCVLIAGGGTGGHLFPGVAVAHALAQESPGIRLAFVSAGRALESRILRQSGLDLLPLKARAFRGAGLWGRLRSVAALPGAVLSAMSLIRRHRPGLVLAVGGYASVPLGLAAFIAGVPLAVQEQNAVPGLANRLLSRTARVVFTSFAEAHKHLPPAKVRLMGNPVREQLLIEAKKAAAERGGIDGRFTVLILGGSQGARSINLAMIQALPLLRERKGGLHFIHQTGASQEEEVRRAYAEHGFSAEVKAFFRDMGRLYGVSSLVICRAGAGTLTEVAAVGRAAVCVPYPHAAGDHQALNARAMESEGAARLIDDSGINGETAASAITELMDSPSELKAMEGRALALARPEAAREIACQCLSLMKEAA